MTKEELVEKLNRLYEKGRQDENGDMYNETNTNQDDYILEMAENIMKSFQNGITKLII